MPSSAIHEVSSDSLSKDNEPKEECAFVTEDSGKHMVVDTATMSLTDTFPLMHFSIDSVKVPLMSRSDMRTDDFPVGQYNSTAKERTKVLTYRVMCRSKLVQR